MKLLCCGTLLFLLPITGNAGPDSDPGLFNQGSSRLSIHLGNAVAFDQNYSIIGIGFGYYISDGIELGLDAETWSGNSPRIEQISPQVRGVLNLDGYFKPYAGAFYLRTQIKGYRDYDTVGARVGAYFMAGDNAYFGAGLVQSTHLNCDRTVYASCTETYPELLFAFAFR